MRLTPLFSLVSALSLPLSVCVQTVCAQSVVPDGSLGTMATYGGIDTKITGGSTSGTNLFHSFRQFSIPSGNTATFDLLNAQNIRTIFSRVTGPSISEINGRLGVINGSGPVSLFLMNPNGIIFGPNAKLDISGSFVGTTADRIQFKDGLDLTTTTTAPLLSVNVPIGLQMGSTPGAITVQGTGHLLRTQSPLLAPYFPIAPMSGLSVAPRNTLALIGGPMAIDGGVLTAPEGRVELASLGRGASVPILQPTSMNTSAIVLGDIIGDRNSIQLSNKALVDVNGINAGSIQVQGKQVDLTMGAMLWVQNRGQNTAGDIQVNATDRILLDGTAPDFILITPTGVLFNSVSAIVSESISSGQGGNINLNAPTITVQNGANIMSRPFAQGAGGDIKLQAQTLNIMGVSAIIPDIFSVISSNATGVGNGGNITATVRDLSLLNGGTLSASTIGPGAGGNIIVNADTILVSGLSPRLSASSLTTPTLGRSGNSGDLFINTRKLTVEKGGLVVTSSVGPGNAGKLTIQASESIDLIGQIQPENSAYNTAIASAVSFAQEPYLSLFNITEKPAGSAGTIKITTPKLKLSGRAYITVNNEGSGVAGNLNIQADRLELNNGSSLGAGSRTGEGGNINVTSNTLLLQTLSRISTSAQGSGNGGNIKIDSNLIVGIGNSDIFANAEAGNGGAIDITTQGLFGLKFRPSLTFRNDITASSQSGMNGTVQINNFTIDPSAALNTLPIDFANANQQISNNCDTKQTNSFVSTGRGGIPKNPSQRLTLIRPWEDMRSPIVSTASSNSPKPEPQPIASRFEANHLQKNADGSIELIANSSTFHPLPPATCAVAAF